MRADLAEAAGTLRRAATERVAALRFGAGRRLLAVQSAGRTLEVFRCKLRWNSIVMYKMLGAVRLYMSSRALHFMGCRDCPLRYFLRCVWQL